ncbi:uncharacterized protein TrAFT101_006413 [Trichoderma asperellum]|uniref:Uncharacterized protein n=1 Tax=Trichoderma asperellum (strain ATCC 204424 / CBS 433.97 / NBRC 101777) TaxID=1042311 RepID=A0A2T3YRA4_TRIA4|nr:hypothetical protein M441DRAFT_63028 [Trichoderma asperellum CBS 433.97]PTB35054.1 hypothetical protein M441DRAFT_63028 [Trichoderma asperellum CBS 433.97]UKZ91435.1 hypothetical protein TrAFT101_006413 [Trichoderma asperellum]
MAPSLFVAPAKSEVNFPLDVSILLFPGRRSRPVHHVSAETDVAWLAIELAIVWKFFVETKGPSLEAIAAVFDGYPAADSSEIIDFKKKSDEN